MKYYSLSSTTQEVCLPDIEDEEQDGVMGSVWGSLFGTSRSEARPSTEATVSDAAPLGLLDLPVFAQYVIHQCL